MPAAGAANHPRTHQPTAGVSSGPNSVPSPHPQNKPQQGTTPGSGQYGCLSSTQPPPQPPHGDCCVTRGEHSKTRSKHSPPTWELLRKEVIQPHLPVRLPCYDFVLIASPTFDGSPPPKRRVRPPASGVTNFHDVTGGVYKARERIHRGIADPRLLATPTSRGRVADPDPN